MLIRVPHSDNRNTQPLTQVMVYLPSGEQLSAKVSDSVYVYDFQLPEGVGEDEVDVYSIFLGRDQQPAYGCGPVCLKRATKVAKPEPVKETVNEPEPAAVSADVADKPAIVATATDEPVAEPLSAADAEPVAAATPVADTDLPAPAAVEPESAADTTADAGLEPAAVSEPRADAALSAATTDAVDVAE